MNLRKALVLLLTLCMVVSIMSPAAYAAQGKVISGADSKGNASNSVSNVETAETGKTLRDQLLENQKTQSDKKGSLASEALGRLKNETMEELAKAAETFAPSDVVSVFVVLEDDPTSETYDDINEVPEKDTRSLMEKQKAMLDAIRGRVDAESTLTVRYHFTYLVNAFSIDTEFKNLTEIAELPGVKTVFIMPEYSALSTEDDGIYTKTASSSQMTGVPSVWADCGYTGTGMRVAIVDTGLDLDHPAFAEVPELTATSLSVEEIAGVLENLNAYKMMAYQGYEIDAEDLYRSGKVPFAFNYSDWNLTADHSADYQGDHGTHVAGIAGANRVEGVDSVGMAPDAQIIVMKVFGNAGSMMDGVIAALEDALVLDCDVVNMSLGSSAGFTSTSPIIDEIFERVSKQDMILAVAAGNEYTSGLMNSWGLHLNTTANPDNGTVDAPGTYINSTVVASVNNAMVESAYFSYGENGTKVGYNDTNGIPLFATLAELGELEYVFVPGLGEDADYEGLDVRGKIALVTRGTTTFMEKMQNAAEHGAAGVLIVNNVTGSVASFRMDFTGITEPIVPCVMISLENGAAMAAAEKHTMVVSAETGLVPDETGGQMSEFTSWGVTPDLRLLPNLAGVGGNVMSTYDNGEYGLMSGTSMATPQVAGISALVLQYLRENFPHLNDDARRVIADALLMSTAIPVVNSTTGVEASPRQQGSGLVNAIGAVTSGAYLSVEGESFGSPKPQIELGDDAEKTGKYKFSFRVNNLTGDEKTYNVSGSLLTEEVYDYYGMKFMDGTDRELSGSVRFDSDTITVPAYGSVEVQVIVTLSDDDKAWIEENFENGIYVEGYVYLTAEEGGVDLSLPYMGFYGDWNEAPIFDSGYWYEENFWDENAMPTYNQTQHIVWTSLGETDWVLGINPYTNYYTEAMYDTRNNVVSPNGDGYLDGLSDIYLSLMRNARTINYTVTDAEGNVLYHVEDPLCKKSLYLIAYDLMYPNLFSWSGYPMYDFTDAEGNVLPDGTTVTMSIQALTDYEDGGADVNKFNTIEIPITVDVSAPVLENVEQIVAGDRNYVKLTVSDVSSLAYVVLTNPTGTRYLDSQLDGVDFVRNEDNTWNVLFDVTDYGPDMQVILCDYGANEGVYDIEFTVADNMPELEEGTLYGYRIYDANLSAMGYYDYQYGWQAIDKDTATLTEQTNDYMEYYAITAAEYVDGLVFAVDAGGNLIWMEPGLWNRYQICNLGTDLLDMTFDDTTDTMYILYKGTVQDYWGDEVEAIVLATMDLLTGQLETLMTYDTYSGPWCITDVNGELYVGMWYSSFFGKLDENYEVVTLLDYKEDYVMLPGDTYYAQSMTYSEADNCIYWAHYSYTGSTFLKIDFTYGEVRDFEFTTNPMPGDAEMVGLFVLEETDYQIPESTVAESLVLNKDSLQLMVGEQDTLLAAPLPWNVPMGEVTWSSSDETIATVENGVVTGVSNGYAEITVTDGVLSASCVVRVIEVSGHVYGYNYYAATTEGQYTWGTWFDLNMGNMEIYATHDGVCPVDFISADYNGHDGKVYGYNDIGQFYCYDPATNEAVALGEGLRGGIPQDMAYDYSTGTMYAATVSADGYGTLSTVDLSNGALTELQNTMDAMYYGEGWFQAPMLDENGDYVLDEYGWPMYEVLPHAYEAYPSGEVYMTLAWSPEGLFAVTAMGNLVHLKPALSVDYMYGTYEEVLAGEVILEGLGYPQYYQSMAYDHANDKLVWASVENYGIVWMDPWDPAVVFLGAPEGLMMFEFVGMHTVPEVIPELPEIPVESVTAENMTLVTNAVKASGVTIYPSNATNTKVTYTSDNEAVATVDAIGNVTAVAPGAAVITVAVEDVAGNVLETSYTVTVLQGTGTIYGHLAGDVGDGSSQYWLWFEDSDPSTMAGQWADLFYYSAEYCADTGYIYAYGYDPEDWSGRWFFVTMDTEWNVIDQKVMSQNFPFVYDLTYNYAEGIMYAVADVSDTSSDLYMVNLSTGALLPAMELVDYEGNEMCVLGLAASPDGRLYGIANSTTGMDWETWQEVTLDAVLYELVPSTQEIIPIGYTGFKHNMLGSMAFDMDTGNLYWAACYNSGAGYESHMCLVDPETGAAVSLGTPSVSGALISGMYILADEYPECQAGLSIIAGQKNLSGYVGDVLAPAVITTGTTNPVVWTSGNSEIVSVEADGTIVAVAPGVTTVTGTITDDEGNTASATFGVTVIADDAYFLAYNNMTNTWEMVNRLDPANATPIEGSTSEAALWVAEAVNGVIYAYDVEGNFYSINGTTFECAKLGTLELSGTFAEIRDLGYDPTTGRLLALIADENMCASIYEVNMAFGSVTKLMDIATYDYYGDFIGGEQVNGMTVGLDGTVYVFDSYPNWGTQDSINILDMETGELIFLNSLNRVSVYTDNYANMTMITDPLTGMIYIMSTSNEMYYTLSSFSPDTNLVETYGALGETHMEYDQWGWSTLVGNTYSTMVSLDTHSHVFVGEAETVTDGDCSIYEATVQHCLLCGDVLTVIADHDYSVFVETVPADCVNAGYDLYKCSDENCTATMQTNFVPAIGHTPGEEADCENAQVCTVCGEVLTAALGHYLEGEFCTYGNQTGDCGRCGQEVTVYINWDSEQIVGHNMVAENGETYCVQTRTTGVCTRCGYKNTRWYAPGEGHVNPDPDNVTDCTAGYDCERCGVHVDAEHSQHCYDRVINEVSCDVDGGRIYSCVRCEAEKVYVEEEATGHNFVDGICSVCGEVEEGVVICVHANTVVEGAAEATCTTDGYTGDVICSDCGETVTKGEVITAAGHDYESVVTPPTCGEGGYTTYTCSVCGDSYTADETEPTGEHTYENGVCSVCGAAEPVCEHTNTKVVGAVAASCTGSGYTGDIICADCGEVLVEGQPVAPTGHVPTQIAASAPTCTTPGSTGGVMCVACHTWLTAPGTIPATGHTEVTDAAVEATCTTTGLTEGKHCDVCGEVLVAQEEVAVLPHTEVVDAAVEATCTTTGLTEGKHCDVCGEVLVAQEEVAVLPHTEVVDEAVAATCTTTGLTKGKHCDVCGEVLVAQTEVAFAAHKYGTWGINKGATCTEPGEGIRTCTVCGASETCVLEPTGIHAFGAWTVTTEPTCTVAGVETRTCSCGETQTREVAATGVHTFGEWTVTKEATTEAVGEETRTCACGETETREIPMLVIEDEGGMSPAVIAVIVVAALGAAAAVVFIVLKKKRG